MNVITDNGTYGVYRENDGTWNVYLDQHDTFGPQHLDGGFDNRMHANVACAYHVELDRMGWNPAGYCLPSEDELTDTQAFFDELAERTDEVDYVRAFVADVVNGDCHE